MKVVSPSKEVCSFCISCSVLPLVSEVQAAFQYFKGAYKKAREELFREECSIRTRGNGFKIKECRFRLDAAVRVLRYQNKLPREVAYTPSLKMF